MGEMAVLRQDAVSLGEAEEELITAWIIDHQVAGSPKNPPSPELPWLRFAPDYIQRGDCGLARSAGSTFREMNISPLPTFSSVTYRPKCSQPFEPPSNTLNVYTYINITIAKNKIAHFASSCYKLSANSQHSVQKTRLGIFSGTVSCRMRWPSCSSRCRLQNPSPRVLRSLAES